MIGLEKTLSRILAERQLASRPRAALMTHVVLGYPSLRESMEIVRVMADAGASLIELQIPFSDPMADGPTIMRACESALEQGVRPIDCLKAAAKLAHEIDVPLLFMSYYNILFAYGKKSRKKEGENGGVAAFCRDTYAAGVEGLIVPDLPYHLVRDEYWEIVRENNLAAIPVVAPVTTDKRLKELSSVVNDGFVYCVSATRTTGARNALPTELGSYLKRVGKYFEIPRAVGFGISNAKQVRQVGESAEIAVVGSATIDIISRAAPRTRKAKVAKFIRSLANA